MCQMTGNMLFVNFIGTFVSNANGVYIITTNVYFIHMTSMHMNFIDMTFIHMTFIHMISGMHSQYNLHNNKWRF